MYSLLKPGFSTLVTLGLILGLTLVYLLRRRRPPKYPPGPLRLPIIGNLHNLGTRPHETFAKMRETYGDIIAVDFADKKVVVLNDYKSIREALSSPDSTGRVKLYPLLQMYGGDKLRGIIASEGTLWQEQRRFFLKTLRDFGFGKKSMEHLIQTEVIELVQNLSKLNGKPFKTQGIFNLAVVNSLWSILTGHRFSHDDQILLEMVKCITEAMTSGGLGSSFMFFPILCKLIPTISGYTQFINHQLKVREMIQDQVRQHVATFQDDDLRDVVDVALKEIAETNDPTSSFYKSEGEINLVGSLADLFYTGLETTSTTLSWITLYLSVHRDVQDKVHEEIKRVVGLTRYPSLADRQEMPYTEAVMLEVIRISTLVPLTMFHRATNDILLRDYVIPKNTLMLANIYAAHHDPTVWDNPDVFRPERFIMADGRVDRHHDGFVAFGPGKRVCVGESLARDEVFLFATHIFQKFSVEPDPTKPKPSLRGVSGFVLAPGACEFILHDRA